MEEIEFPKWNGYKDLTAVKELVNVGCCHNPDLILEYAGKAFIEREYFKNILFFVQQRVRKHIEEGEELGLGLDSSREIFEGFMLTPFPGL